MNERDLIKLLIEMFGTTSPANTQSDGDKLIVFRPDAGVDSYLNIVELTSFGTQIGVVVNTEPVSMLSTLNVKSNFSVNSTKFKVTATTGNTTIAGTLGVTGATTLASTLSATKVSANTAEDVDSDTDDVLTTTIANTEYGMLLVRETAGTEMCLYLIAGGTIEKVSADATFTVTKDNASTYNVYFETNVIKIQNKVGDNKVIRAGLFSI